MGRLAGKEAANKDDNIIGYLAYCERRGGSTKGRKELLASLEAGLTVDGYGVMGGSERRQV